MDGDDIDEGWFDRTRWSHAIDTVVRVFSSNPMSLTLTGNPIMSIKDTLRVHQTMPTLRLKLQFSQPYVLFASTLGFRIPATTLSATHPGMDLYSKNSCNQCPQ